MLSLCSLDPPPKMVAHSSEEEVERESCPTVSFKKHKHSIDGLSLIGFGVIRRMDWCGILSYILYTTHRDWHFNFAHGICGASGFPDIRRIRGVSLNSQSNTMSITSQNSLQTLVCGEKLSTSKYDRTICRPVREVLLVSMFVIHRKTLG